MEKKASAEKAIRAREFRVIVDAAHVGNSSRQKRWSAPHFYGVGENCRADIDAAQNGPFFQFRRRRDKVAA